MNEVQQIMLKALKPVAISIKCADLPFAGVSLMSVSGNYISGIRPGTLQNTMSTCELSSKRNLAGTII